MLATREEVYPYLKARLQSLALQLGERVLETPNNPISLAMTLNTLVPKPSISNAAETSAAAEDEGAQSDMERKQRKLATFFGSMLWSR